MPSIQSVNASSAVSVRELRENVSMSRAQHQTKKDGLDQIYVEGNDGKSYVAYGRSIENASRLNPGDAINITTSDGRQVRGTVAFVDDEATSALEGAARPFQKIGSWAGIAGGAAAGAAGGAAISFGGGLGAALGGSIAGFTVGAIGAAALAGGAIVAGVVGGGIAAVGAVQGSINHADSSQIESLVK